MAWKSVIGQERVKDLLISSLRQNRLAHAYLFSGPGGVGKDALAIELAKVLNCENAVFEACDTCSNCVKFQSLQHPNIHLIFSLPVGKNEVSGDPPLEKLTDEQISTVKEQLALKAQNLYHDIVVPKATTIKVNSIREIRRTLSLRSFGKGKSVSIIMDADQLNDESSNALLKTLEEPHENNLLILTTARPDYLLPTIVSRCQQVRFDILRNEEIQDALVRRKQLDASRAAIIAQLANGSYARALELISTSLLELRNEAVEFLRSALHRKREDFLQAIDNIVTGSNRPEIEQFLYLLQSWLRDTMAAREGSGRVVNIDNLDALKKFVDHYPEIDDVAVARLIQRAISLLNKNVYIPLILLNLGIELRKLILPKSSECNRTARTAS
ncbi:MAG: DNA polymerase III subunit [Bacteroidota bacterium]|jgi:DNA polymerase-3 subunit delta'